MEEQYSSRKDNIESLLSQNRTGGDAYPEYAEAYGEDLQHSDMELDFMDASSENNHEGGFSNIAKMAAKGMSVAQQGISAAQKGLDDVQEAQAKAQKIAADAQAQAQQVQKVAADARKMKGGFSARLGGLALGGAKYCIDTSNLMQVIMIFALILLLVFLFHTLFMRADVLRTPQTEVPVVFMTRGY